MLVCQGWLRGCEMLDGDVTTFPIRRFEGRLAAWRAISMGFMVCFSSFSFYFFAQKRAHSDFQLDAEGGNRPGSKCNVLVHCYIKDRKAREASQPTLRPNFI